MAMSLLLAFGAFAGYARAADAGSSDVSPGLQVPPGAVFTDPHSFAVLGSNGTFRNGTEIFNPTSTPAPFFQVFSPKFLRVLGDKPAIRVIAVDNSSTNFAFEAPYWDKNSDHVFFSSGDTTLNNNNHVSRIDLQDETLKSGGLAAVEKLTLADDVQGINGATPYHGEMLLATLGRGNAPGGLVLVHPEEPYNSTFLLDNFLGRQFNSLNDVKVHPTSGNIFFTDVSYGHINGFRTPEPQQPNMVYRFDPNTGAVRVVADGFIQSNGIAFTADGKTAYVTDTSASGGAEGNFPTRPATIYAFDVDEKSQAFANRRVFAYADVGAPDGIQLCIEQNVFAGAGDGVHVWSPDGELIGKFFLGTRAVNMVFAGNRLIITAQTAVYMADIAASGMDLYSI